MTRQSINIEGYSHGGQPIPAASLIGEILMTGGVSGMDLTTGTLPDDVNEQARLMFENLGRILQAAGTSFDDVLRMTIYVKVPEARPAVNREWLVTFPDAASRPARHTLQYDHLPSNMLVQCDATAVRRGGDHAGR
jgi:enamine deaminase RidA (YjgF/YER057c/UK114 family)